MPAQLNYRRTSNSVTNIHEHFGSGRSIATSSNSTPVSKLEKSKHNSKIFSFLFSSSKPNTSKSSDLSCIGSSQHVITRSTNINNNNHYNLGSSLLPNTTSSLSTSPSSSSATDATAATVTTATYSKNPHIEGASSHLLNLTSLPVPHHLVRNPSDHLTVNNYPSISSTNSSHHHNKPISCPTSPSSPIEQAASIDDAEEDDARLTNNARSASSSDSTCILSSSLETPKSSMYM